MLLAYAGLVLAAVGSVAALDAPAPEPVVTLIAVGDVMLSRAVARAIHEHKDIHYPFLRVTEMLKSGDITFGNLECPITKGPIIRPGQMVFHADPGVEPALKDAGFTVMSIANNHLPDFGPKGVRDTLQALDAVGVAHAGAGIDDVSAAAPAIVTMHGLRFAFLAYNDHDVVPDRYLAAPGHPGTNVMDEDNVTAGVQAARRKADIVIVSMHSGWEYRKANPRQALFARAAIDAGADIVIGHHPHVVQRVERYKGKLILYSLGNFVFDQKQTAAVRQGIAARITFGRTGVRSVQFLPVDIEGSQPRIATNQRLRRRILARLEIPLADDGTLLPDAAAAAKR